METFHEDFARCSTSHLAKRKQAIYLLLVEALRDGRVIEERIIGVLSVSDGEQETDLSSLESGLRYLLGDLGVVIDDDPHAPDTFLPADEDDEELYGDTAKEGLDFLWCHQARDTSPYYCYMEDLPNEILTRDDELELGRMIDRGIMVDEARKRFFEANLRLVIQVSKGYGGLTFMDRIQEGNIGLMRAVERFDYKRGTTFSTHAAWWIRKEIGRAVMDADRIIRLPGQVHKRVGKIKKALKQTNTRTGQELDVERTADLAGMPAEQVFTYLGLLDEPLRFEDCWDELKNIPDEEAHDRIQTIAELKVRVRRLLDALDPRAAGIVRMRFGIDYDKEHTLSEIGKIEGVTGTRIRQIELEALRVIKHPAHSWHLRGYVQEECRKHPFVATLLRQLGVAP